MALMALAMAIPQNAKAYHFYSTAPSGQTLYYEVIGPGAVKVVSENSSVPYYSTAMSGTLVVPDSVSYNGDIYLVTQIGNSAFISCSTLVSVVLPGTVTTIGNYAFNDCNGLTSITIPCSVTSIGNTAFNLCSNLTRVNYSGTISQWCGINFRNRIANPLFHAHHLYIDSTEVTDPVISGIVLIRPNAFVNCTGLHTVDIDSMVTTIGLDAFCGCSGLVSVSIGSSVTSIEQNAFSSCSGLAEITSLAVIPPTLATPVFSAVTSSIPVYIPCGSLTAYDSLWNHFSNFIEVPGVSLNLQSANIDMGTVTLLAGPTCQDSTAIVSATADSGYHFDHWSNGNIANPDTLNLSGDSVIVAYFVPNQYSITVLSADTSMGTVTGSGTYSLLDTITIMAAANTGYTFLRWDDGNVDRVRSIVVHSNATYTAYFGSIEGIGDATETVNCKIYLRNSSIVVEGAEDETVLIFDIMGRMVANHALPSGIYLVRIGDRPARKVTVIRQ